MCKSLYQIAKVLVLNIILLLQLICAEVSEIDSYSTIEQEIKIIESQVSLDKVWILNLPTLSEEAISAVLDRSQNFNRSLFALKMPPIQNNFADLHDCINKFLSARLWWSLKRYVLMSTSQVLFAVFERASPLLEKSLRVIALQNFPASQRLCKQRPLAVANMDGKSWGNGARFITGFLRQREKYVVLLHATQAGNYTDTTIFNSKHECPSLLNKHECLFLPSTNCSVDIFNITMNLAAQKANLYLHADYSAVPMSREVSHIKTLSKFIVDDSGQLAANQYSIGDDHSYCITGRAPKVIFDESVVSKPIKKDTYSAAKYIFGYVNRIRSEFRVRVQLYIDSFRSSFTPPFFSNMSCVMIHVPRANRHVPDVNMSSWCENRINWNHNISWRGVGSRGNLSTCHMNLPFGCATIEHYLNASMLLAPTVNNLFVATDDPTWLKKRIKTYKKLTDNLISKHGFKFYIYHPTVGTGYHFNRTRDAAAEVFATIEVGQQCQGFVGYLKTQSIAEFFYHAMCYYSRLEYLKCPPSFSFG